MGHLIRDFTGFFKTETKIHADGTVEVYREQDVENIIEANKRDQVDSNFKNGFSESGDMKHVARVPLIVWEQWWMEACKHHGRNIPYYGREMNEFSRQKLNDPDNRFLRTGLGEIGKGGQ